MAKIKHNKLKNTGIIFEILCRRLVSEMLNGTTNHASKILKKHFNKNSKLISELKLYQQLTKQVENIDSKELLDEVIKIRKSKNFDGLEKEKYNLVRDIKNNYNLTEFYDSRISNYKLFASIYNIFEFDVSHTPDVYLQNKKYIIECISENTNTPVVNDTEKILQSSDPDVRKLGFKFLVEKFNDKYKNFSVKQKKLLNEYIVHDITSTEFKQFILNECNQLKNSFNNEIYKMEDGQFKIKLTETVKLIEMIGKSNTIKDEYVSSLLKFYELIDEIKK